jgi:Spy/CpxP family protein refolding chaperone
VNRWKAILAAALIFATGVGTGVLTHRAATQAANPPARDPRTPPPGFDGRPDFLSRLKRDLSLSDEQAARIDTILQEGRKRNRQIWETIQPKLREEMKQARERIHAELNPEQRTKYDEIMKRSRERRGPRPDGPPGPGPGPGPGSDAGRRHGGQKSPPQGDSNPPPAQPVAPPG